MRWLNRIMLVAAMTLCSVSQAMTMQELFDEVNAVGNVSRPAALQGQTMNIYTGGACSCGCRTRPTSWPL